MAASILFSDVTTSPTPPTHIAIIMDGNGRWAEQHGLPRSCGHRRGAQAAKETMLAALEFGVRFVTLYSFSAENWRRPVEEVEDLISLLRYTIRREAGEMGDNGVRLWVIGDRTRLPDDVLAAIEDAESRTAGNDRLTAVIALSYGSRAEIVHAAQTLAAQVAAGKLSPDAIDETMFARHLYTVDIPDPDLLIRTSGEQRVSNFLLWQLAYTEFVFPQILWPDFGRTALAEAIDAFHHRERRYGGRNIG